MKFAGLIGSALCATVAIAADNPVAPVADAGVFRHRGRYCLVGVRTNGEGFVSTDLVRWRDASGRVLERSPGMVRDWRGGFPMWPRDDHVYSHAYLNGVHHLHSNGIGHGVSETFTGPYREVRPFAPGIDPFVFRDRDGEFYFYSMVHVPYEQDNRYWGNVVWVQEMDDPGRLRGEPTRLLHASPEIPWEVRDHRIAEGPYVVRYRDRYHLLYNANHTHHLLGNYGIGVAVADSPTGFSAAGKRPDPVLKDNRDDVAACYRPIVPGAGEPGVPVPRRYSDVPPPAGWVALDFDDSEWREGSAGIGDVGEILADVRHAYGRSRVFPEGTRVPGSELYLRTSFTLDRVPERRLALLVRHVGDAVVMLNGAEVHRSDGWLQKPRFILLDGAARALLRPGRNCLAVSCRRATGQPVYADVGLYEMTGETPVDYIYNCGQPNLLRGPNGFEWWLVYFGIWNGSRHALGIDRVHFRDRDLYVDGPTCANTPGFHPPPAKPAFAATAGEPGLSWDAPGVLAERDGAFAAVGNDLAEGLPVPAPASRHYLFEADVRVPDGTLEAGVLAAAVDAETWVRVGLSADEASLTLSADGDVVRRVLPLPGAFDRDTFHHLRVERNGRSLRLAVDGVEPTVPLPELPFDEASRPGLVSLGGPAAWDGVLYTIGWDEWGSGISGWAPAEQARIGDDGLLLEAESGLVAVTKGEAFDACEFSVRAYPVGGPGGRFGFVPVAGDAADRLQAVADVSAGTVTVSGARGGQPVGPLTFPVAGLAAGPTFRAVRLRDRVILFVDGVESVSVPGTWPPSGVGLQAEGVRARFDGICCFALP